MKGEFWEIASQARDDVLHDTLTEPCGALYTIADTKVAPALQAHQEELKRHQLEVSLMLACHHEVYINRPSTCYV